MGLVLDRLMLQRKLSSMTLQPRLQLLADQGRTASSSRQSRPCPQPMMQVPPQLLRQHTHTTTGLLGAATLF